MSTSSDPLYSFAFRGILTKHALEKTLAQKKSRTVNDLDDLEKLSVSLGIHNMDPEVVAKARRMSIVYISIVSFENSIRDFVFKILSDIKGDKWWDECVSEKIKVKAESRREEEEKIKWHITRGSNKINYLEFGDLGLIIKNNWEPFKPHLMSIEWAEQIIKTVERSRNVIMHGGDLANHDIERIGTLIRDWLNQLGE